MDRETCLDFQRIQVTDDESLDTYNNIMAQLQLDRRLPEGRRTCERLLEDLGLQPARTDQEDRTYKQFVFQGLCVVLGESGVGKTSLVKSLTGKPFDPEEPKTQGIDQSLVNETWQNLKLKDLMFGNFSRFFKNVFVQLTVFGKAGNVIVQESTKLLGSNLQWRLRPTLLFSILMALFLFLYCLAENMHPGIILLFVGFFSTWPIALWGIFHLESMRLIAIACCFFVNYRGLLLGASIACSFSLSCFTLICVLFLYLCKAKLFQQSFSIVRKCRYPGQVKFKNQPPVEIIFIGRFVINVIIGFTFTCFTILMIHTCNTNRTKLTRHLIITLVRWVVVILCHLFMLVQSVPRILKSIPGWRYKLLLIYFVMVCLYIGARTELPQEVTTVITFLLFCCDTIYKECFCITSTVATIDNDHQDSTNVTAVCIEKAEMNEKYLRNALNEKFSSLKLKILDFAGDKEYCAYHHMFLRSQAIYVIVFNMAEFSENSFIDIHARIKTLHLWFESICSQVPLKTPNSKLPGVQTLQKTIMTVAEKRKATIGSDIPLSWIQIQDKIISLRENKKAKFCLTLEEFPTAFGTFICTNWSEETLKYFHERGLVLYLDKDQDLSKWVLLKPEILVDIIIQLVTPPPKLIQERGFRRDWKLLHDKGMLTKSLLTRIISTVQENEEAMTAFLEKYDLICPLANNKVKMCSLYDDEEHQPTHFVPPLLPMSADGCIPTWHDNTTDKTFYVFFKRFLPEPLFHRLLSRAHKNSKVESPNGSVVMFKDVGKFWMSPWQPYRLKLMKEEAIIEVTFSSR